MVSIIVNCRYLTKAGHVCKIHLCSFWSPSGLIPSPSLVSSFGSLTQYQVCFGKAHPALLQQETWTDSWGCCLNRQIFSLFDCRFLSVDSTVLNGEMKVFRFCVLHKHQPPDKPAVVWLQACLGQCQYFSRPLNEQTVFYQQGFCVIVTHHCPLMPCIHVREKNVCESMHTHSPF